MHYTGPVYRPPPEADTPLLEITYGCSWDKCSFCSMYHTQKFGISPIEDIKQDLEETYTCDNCNSIFKIKANIQYKTEKVVNLQNSYIQKL